MLAIHERCVDDLVREAVAFHGRLCPGQVLGVRMAVAGCQALGFDHPRQAGQRLVVLVEIDRCLTDAIQAVTGGGEGWDVGSPLLVVLAFAVGCLALAPLTLRRRTA